MVCIVDEAVSPVVPLWQRDPQPGVHVLQKLAAVLDGLQGQCPRQQGGFAVSRPVPTNQEGKHLSQCGPTWGGQNGGVSGPRASPCPHGEAQMANPPLLPWRGPDCRSLPCPRLLGPGRTQRDGIAGVCFFTQRLGSLS